MAERVPQDFCGAAPRRIELIYLSSDEEEELDNLSVTSVMDLQLTSDDEEYDDEIMMNVLRWSYQRPFPSLVHQV